jgi:tetratricopeptide (TPR) repeat protein
VKPDSFCIYCKRGIDLARRLNDKPGIAGLNLKMASLLVDTGNYALALKYAQESLSLGQELDSKPTVITSYVLIGQVFDYQADFVKSADYFFKALTISQQINDHAETAMIGTNLAASFFNQADYKKADEYSNLTIKEAISANAPIHIYKALYIMGMSKAMTGDSMAARDDYWKAIEICRKNAFTLNEAEVINDLSSLEKDVDKRIALLKHGRQIYDSLTPSSFNSRANFLHLGEAYLSDFKFHQNKDYLRYAVIRMK